MTILECGAEKTYSAPAEHVVLGTGSYLSSFVRIGAADQLAGSVLFDGNAALHRELLNYDIATLNVIPRPITREVLVFNETDLIIGTYFDTFSGSYGFTTDSLNADGIETYSVVDGCLQDPSETTRSKDSKFGFMDPWDGIRLDIENFGALTGHETEAAEAVAEIDERIAALEAAPQAATPPEVLVFRMNDGSVFTQGKFAPLTSIIASAGGHNVFADKDTTNFGASWEEVAARQPDMIVVPIYHPDNFREQFDQELQVMRSHPALRNSPAVTNDHILAIPLLLTIPGYGNIEAADQIRVAMEKFGLLPESEITPRIDLDKVLG